MVAAALALGWWMVRTPGAGDPPAGAAAAPPEPRLEPQTTLSSGVVQLMVSGNAALARRTPADLREARSAFEQAVLRDERYAPAHAGLALALGQLAHSGLERPSAVLPKAVEVADRAVELDPTYAPGWLALARVEVQWTRDWNRAELHVRRAIALNPRAEEPASLLARLLVALGRNTEAVEQSLQALQINPASPTLLTSTGIVHHIVGRDADALRYFEQALGVDPSHAEAALWRALTLAAIGRPDEAIEWAVRSRDESAGRPSWVMGYVQARAGRRREAEEVLEAMAVQASQSYLPAMELAYVTLALGQREVALQWIETGVREHSRWAELLAVDRILEPLRDEARYHAALALMKLGESR